MLGVVFYTRLTFFAYFDLSMFSVMGKAWVDWVARRTGRHTMPRPLASTRRRGYWFTRPSNSASTSAKANLHGGIMGFLTELWTFVRVRKKFWLLPIIVMLGLFGGLVVLSQGSAVAPFIYTIF